MSWKNPSPKYVSLFVKSQPLEKLVHCRNEGRVLILTEVDILRLLPTPWSTRKKMVFGLMYLFPDGAKEFCSNFPGKSGAGIRAANLAAIPLRSGSLAGITFACPAI